MNDIETRLACFAINSFGGHAHPAADKENFEFFRPAYIAECLQRLTDNPNVTDEAKEIAHRLLIHFPKA